MSRAQTSMKGVAEVVRSTFRQSPWDADAPPVGIALHASAAEDHCVSQPPPVRSLVPTAGDRGARFTLLATVLVVYTPWLIYMFRARQFHLFVDNWLMSATMVAGSFIAGSTCIGGGAVAFPVMNLLFGTSPESARNFSLAIQSVGMTAASFAIWRAKMPVERNALLFGSLGGTAGVVLGTFAVVPLFTNPAYVKMFFAALWLSFIVALYLVNRDRTREVLLEIEDFTIARAGLVLAVAGAVGGIVTSLTGSGLDTLVFSFLCLKFRISEKVATPTSVILMAVNSGVGLMTHLFLIHAPEGGIAYWLGDFHVEARDFWLVCIPVVVIGAPAGARFIRDKSRLFVAALLYSCIICQFAATVLILRPSGWLAVFTLVVFLSGACLFVLLAGAGRAAGGRTPSTFRGLSHG